MVVRGIGIFSRFLRLFGVRECDWMVDIPPGGGGRVRRDGMGWDLRGKSCSVLCVSWGLNGREGDRVLFSFLFSPFFVFWDEHLATPLYFLLCGIALYHPV